MAPSWTDHFTLANLSLRHENPKIFVISQWQYDKERPSLLYLFVRIAIFITFFVIWLLTITMQDEGGRRTWAIYLTNWGFSLCLFQSFVPCIMLTIMLIEANWDYQLYWSNKALKLHSTYWGLNIMATTVAFTITLIYWTLIYSAEGAYWSTMNFMVHGFNSILMLLDFSILSHPVRLVHCLYPFLFALTYSIMTAIYYAAGGTTKNGSKYIYPILKWDEPGVTIAYCIGIGVLMIIIHMITFLIHKLREKFAPPTVNLVQRKIFNCYDVENYY